MIIKNKDLDEVENSDKDLYEIPEGEIMTRSPVLTVCWKRNTHYLASLTVCGGS